jgi:hypothetical protein
VTAVPFWFDPGATPGATPDWTLAFLGPTAELPALAAEVLRDMRASAAARAAAADEARAAADDPLAPAWDGTAGKHAQAGTQPDDGEPVEPADVADAP